MSDKVLSPFCPRPSSKIYSRACTGVYKSIKIVDKVVKTGNGEDDFIVKKVVIEEETPVQKVVDADKDTVGVYNIIAQVMRTGDTSLLPVDQGGETDLVGAPETLMEVKQMGVDASKKFDKLPKELTKGLDMASFVNSMDQKKFDEFIEAISARKAKEKTNDSEVKTNE